MAFFIKTVLFGTKNILIIFVVLIQKLKKWGQPPFDRVAVCGVPGQNPWQEMANSIKAPEGAKFAANDQAQY